MVDKNVFSKIGAKVSDFGKKTVGEIKKTTQEIGDKKKKEDYEKRLKKYNPIFATDYNDENFKLPYIIQIVDDSERKNIDVCQGAIGWIEKSVGVEVLCLYETWLSNCGITFLPTTDCGALYVVDQFCNNNYVRVDRIFLRAHEEKLAELQNIAFLLGAKSCSIEIKESEKAFTSEQNKKGVGVGANVSSVKIGAKSENGEGSSSLSLVYRRGATTATFEGNDTPTRPTLKWFANDENIKGLIEMRCTSTNAIKSKTLILEGSTSATMSRSQASKIDLAIGKLGVKKELKLEQEATKEANSLLVFEVYF